MGMRKKWRATRLVLKEGLEAAFRANPDHVDNCRPRTYYGRFVQGLLMEAVKGKAVSIRMVMSLVDEEAPRNENPDEYEKEVLDWNEDGVWETMPQPEKPEEPDRPGDDRHSPEKRELKRRLERLMAGNEADQARARHIMQAALSGNFDLPAAPRTAQPP